MDGHLVPASSNSKFRCSLENFTLDAERWLAALYWCVRTSYGDDAAHAAADCWLRVFEERLEGSSDLPELTRITAAAIALLVSRLVTSEGLSLIELRFDSRHIGGQSVLIWTSEPGGPPDTELSV
jgi:hypothetical protein